MIVKDQNWINIEPSSEEGLKRALRGNEGKWLVFGKKEELHLYANLLNALVEEGTLFAAKIALKDPSFDPFPHKDCVICAFTASDEEDRRRVRRILGNIGLVPSVWKSNADTIADWEEQGKLSLEYEIADQLRKQLQRPVAEAGSVGSPDVAGRKLRVIMMTDMVNFAADMERDETGTYRKLQIHNDLVRRDLNACNGREMKTIGDAFLVVFESAIDAVECGLRIQESLREHNKRCTIGEKILVRIGIHVGDVILSPTDVFGDGVNVAARIQGLAEPAGICVSDAVFGLVRRAAKLGSERLQQVAMKNIADPPVVHRIWRQEVAESRKSR